MILNFEIDKRRQRAGRIVDRTGDVNHLRHVVPGYISKISQSTVATAAMAHTSGARSVATHALTAGAAV